ncbi:MAG: 2-amino-4-hydroxy-6-hydroxymethyldihydropteridine diphosphokinase [Treponema sp.]|nr:2-amino-4-hydroxy-6-hydroxymethyldihydropteridine diphosphokinase [Candidatus Treponema caballi]
MTPVVLGLGSNRALSNDRAALSPCDVLALACKALSDVLSGLTVSSVYLTKPMYVTDQNDFYNMAVFGFYDGTPESLLEKTQAIEAAYGRDRSKEIRNGPRSLDIDIELFGNEQIDTEKLLVPHPRIYERAFVLVPLLEILPDSADIPSREPFEKALKSIGMQGVQKYGRIFP